MGETLEQTGTPANYIEYIITKVLFCQGRGTKFLKVLKNSFFVYITLRTVYPETSKVLRMHVVLDFFNTREEGVSVDFLWMCQAYGGDKVDIGLALWENAARDDRGRGGTAVLGLFGLAVKLQAIGPAEATLIEQDQPGPLPQEVSAAKCPRGPAGQL